MIAAVLLVSFACLSVGVLLIGIGCVKEAFTPSVVRRVEAGSVAVEETTRGPQASSKLAESFKAPASIGRI